MKESPKQDKQSDKASGAGVAPTGIAEIGPRAAWVVLALLLIAFNVVKFTFIEYSNSDENIYFYMGKLVSQGVLPYSEFRCAHPPVKLLLAAFPFLFDAFPFTALKMLPVITTNGIALLVFLLLSRAHSRLAGLIGAGLLLSSFSGLYYTSYYMGTHLTVLPIVGALVALQRKRDVIAGALLAIAMLTGVYAGCAAAAVGGYLLFTERGRLWRLLGGFFALWLPVNLLLWGWLGQGYIDHVYLFHFMKKAIDSVAPSDTLRGMVDLNPVLLTLGAAFVVLRDKSGDLPFLVGVSFLGFFVIFPSIHEYYFALPAPFLAVAGALVLVRALSWLKLSPKATGIALTSALAVFVMTNLPPARLSIRNNSFPQMPEFAGMLKDLDPGGEYVFGQAEQVPLLAMISGRQILDHHVDTNGKVYATGSDDLVRIQELLATTDGVLVIGREDIEPEGRVVYYGPMAVSEFREFLRTELRLVHGIRSVYNPGERLLIYRRP